MLAVDCTCMHAYNHPSIHPSIWPFSSMVMVVSGKLVILEHSLLMAETTNARFARFLTMPTVVECCVVIHCGAFVSLSVLYGVLDSVILFWLHYIDYITSVMLFWLYYIDYITGILTVGTAQ